MHPVLFKIPWIDFPVSTFGVMMAVGFLVATWITAERLEEQGIDRDLSTTMLLYCMFGGVLGSKLYYAIDVHMRTGIPFFSLLFAREGITWFGGLIAGTLAGVVGTRLHGIPTLLYANAVCIGAAAGQGFGRIGCFLVGDDYGRPTDLPWGIAFPEGAPPTLEKVHPTQLYEMAWLFAVAALLWRRRKRSPFLFGEYMMLAGLGRIFVEMLRVNPRVALGMTEPQWISLGLIAFGAAGWLYYHRGSARPAAA
jgi:phosphatidylglycerol:prolipoprotein diacylglycerol transferase